MRPDPDPTFEAAVEAGRRACAVASPDRAEADGSPAAGIRPELVERCQALIADGLYETDDRIDAAINRLADSWETAHRASRLGA